MRFHRYSQSCAQGEGAAGGGRMHRHFGLFGGTAAGCSTRAMSAWSS